MNDPSPAGDRTPIDDFSQCHAGILNHLQALSTLPALLEPAARARQIAGDTARFFREAVFEHHAEEERELFPAVLASASEGSERQRVQALVQALTAGHRQIEAQWRRLEPGLEAVANGKDAVLDAAAVEALVASYERHARHEEEQFLPLARDILGRNSNHMAALGMSMHLRHSVPRAMKRVRGYL